MGKMKELTEHSMYHKNMEIVQLYETVYEGSWDDVGWMYPCVIVKISGRTYKPTNSSAVRLFALDTPTELAEITEDEKQGIKMIQALQLMADITESDEGALKGWREMSKEDREQTKAAYQFFHRE